MFSLDHRISASRRRLPAFQATQAPCSVAAVVAGPWSSSSPAGLTESQWLAPLRENSTPRRRDAVRSLASCLLGQSPQDAKTMEPAQATETNLPLSSKGWIPGEVICVSTSVQPVPSWLYDRCASLVVLWWPSQRVPPLRQKLGSKALDIADPAPSNVPAGVTWADQSATAMPCAPARWSRQTISAPVLALQCRLAPELRMSLRITGGNHCVPSNSTSTNGPSLSEGCADQATTRRNCPWTLYTQAVGRGGPAGRSPRRTGSPHCCPPSVLTRARMALPARSA